MKLNIYKIVSYIVMANRRPRLCSKSSTKCVTCKKQLKTTTHRASDASIAIPGSTVIIYSRQRIEMEHTHNSRAGHL